MTGRASVQEAGRKIGLLWDDVLADERQRQFYSRALGWLLLGLLIAVGVLGIVSAGGEAARHPACRQADHHLSPKIEPVTLEVAQDAQEVRRLLRGDDAVAYPAAPPHAERLCIEARAQRYRDMLGFDSAVFIPLYVLMGLVAVAWFALVAMRADSSWTPFRGRALPRDLVAWSALSLLCLFVLAILDAGENRAAEHVLDLAVGHPLAAAATSAAGPALDAAARDMRGASLHKWLAAAVWAATLAALAWRLRGELAGSGAGADAGAPGGRARWSRGVVFLLACVGSLAALLLGTGAALGLLVSPGVAASALRCSLSAGFFLVLVYALVLWVLHRLLLPSRPPPAEPNKAEEPPEPPPEKIIFSPAPLGG